MNKETVIDRYFEGDLNEEELKIFSQWLSEDATLKEEFEFQKQVKAAIVLDKRTAAKNVFANIESDLQQRSKKAKLRRLLAVAAVMLLMVSLTLFFNNNSDQQDIYGTFYQSFPNMERPTVRGETKEDIISKAFQAYDAEDFNASANLFEEIYQNDPSDFVILYLGVSYMELGDLDKAIPVFESYQDSETTLYGGYILWYVSLSYVKTGQTDKAVVILKKLADSTHPMQQKSTELLLQLK